MAVYKVPQDVEADDKLLGPFSFRQFIYLIVVAISIALAWGLSQVFIGLVVIPLPFTFFFAALALPLKKDQPMETYLSALFSFYFIKPRKRIWKPDGISEIVQITAPKQTEPPRVKELTSTQAKERLNYLTNIVETRGWAVRGANFLETDRRNVPDANDMMDGDNPEMSKINQLMAQADQKRRQDIAAGIRAPLQTHAPTPIITSAPQSAAKPVENKQVQTAKPTSKEDARAAVLQQIESAKQGAPKPQNTSANEPSPAIINLATNSDELTIETIQKQANRIREEEHGLPDDEVEISLR